MTLNKLKPRLLGIGVVPIVCVAITGCGGSSKPGYCTDRSNLESSVKGLTDLHLSSGVSGLETQLNKIKADATQLAKSAKSDFPDDTKAIESSLDTLKTTVKSLPSSPSASDIASIAVQTSAFVSSVKSFFDATSSKCG